MSQRDEGRSAAITREEFALLVVRVKELEVEIKDLRYAVDHPADCECQGCAG